MEENQPNGFKIGLDKPATESGPSEPPAKAPSPDKKAKKPSKAARKSPGSSVFLLFLGFLVLGAAMVWFYYDIQDRLQTINASGSEEIAELSRQMTEHIEDINNQVSVLQRSLQKEVKTLKSSISDTSSRIDKLRADVAATEENLGSLEQTISLTEDQTQKLNSDIENLNDTTRKLKTDQSEIQNQLSEQSEKIQMVSETMVEQEALDKALKKERESNKQNMAHATETLYSEMASYEDKLKTMRSRIDELKAQIDVLQEQVDNQAQAQEPIKPPSTEQNSEMMPAPENGQIIEQEIE